MKLRDYQIKINDLTKEFLETDEQRGQVYAPTGAGKTVCFTELIKHVISQGKINIAVVHPRIALSKDQLSRFKRDFGTAVHFTSFHSGGRVRGDEAIGEITTLSAADVQRVIAQSDRPHITFSSYQSFNKLITAGLHFDLIICDEAHYLTENRYADVVAGFNADKVIFYTATPISHDFDETIMDESSFGGLIHAVEPKELIKHGYIVAPLVHVMECQTNRRSNKNRVDIIDVIGRSFVDQYRRVTAWGMPYHQMLVAARDVENDLTEVEDRLYDVLAYISDNTDLNSRDIDIYTISSNGAYRNGREVLGGRPQAIKDIKTSGRNVIVVHYDTLAEGIDIDTLSGCVIMRSLSKAKFIQTIGRCARPFAGDLGPNGAPRRGIYNVKRLIDDRAKPRCIVTIPVIDGVWIGNGNAADIAKAFIAAGYDDLSTYMPVVDEPTGKAGQDFRLSEDDAFLSQIRDHQVQERLNNLQDLLFGDI